MGHLGEAEVLDRDLEGVADDERRRAAASGCCTPPPSSSRGRAGSRCTRARPSRRAGSRAPRGEDEVAVVRGELAQVPGLDVLEVDGQPGVGRPDPVGEGARKRRRKQRMASLGTPLFMSTRREAEGRPSAGRNSKYRQTGVTAVSPDVARIAISSRAALPMSPCSPLRSRSSAGPAAPLSDRRAGGADAPLHRPGRGRGLPRLGLLRPPGPHPAADSRIHAYVDLIGRHVGAAGTLRTPDVVELARDDVQRRGGRERLRCPAAATARSRPTWGWCWSRWGTLSRVHHDDIARGIEWVLAEPAAATTSASSTSRAAATTR